MLHFFYETLKLKCCVLLSYDLPERESYPDREEPPNELEQYEECSMDNLQEQDPVPGTSLQENSGVEDAQVHSEPEIV